MTKIPLTASQIKTFDEVATDKMAVEQTLKVAMNYHSNRINEITKVERELWNELMQLHALDPSVTYQTKLVEGQVVITEKED